MTSRLECPTRFASARVRNETSESCGLEPGFNLKLLDQPLDHAVQPVLMRGSYGQKLKADAGRSGPADCGIVDEDWVGLSGDM